jgi:putative oxidoreductase
MNTSDLALLILRLGIGLTFAAHGAQKLFGWWEGPGFSGWQGAVERMGFRPATLFAAISALAEFGGGFLLAVGLLTPLAAALLVAQAVVIIGRVHWSNGFFNGKGGFEFPLLLGVGSLATGLLGPRAFSLDAVLGLGLGDTAQVSLLAASVLAGLAVLLVPRLTAVRSSAGSHA